jgi:hypothetical protein
VVIEEQSRAMEARLLPDTRGAVYTPRHVFERRAFIRYRRWVVGLLTGLSLLLRHLFMEFFHAVTDFSPPCDTFATSLSVQHTPAVDTKGYTPAPETSIALPKKRGERGNTGGD